MADLTAQRRLVKSPPELWAELSELERLARHLDAFGEIRITRLEPERAITWEGEHVSGTVSIEASGWGTKVTLTASLPDVGNATPAPETAPARDPAPPDPAPTDPVRPDPPPRDPAPPELGERAQPRPLGLVARLLARWRADVEDAPIGPDDAPTGPDDAPTGPEDAPTGADDAPTGADDAPTGPEDAPTGPSLSERHEPEQAASELAGEAIAEDPLSRGLAPASAAARARSAAAADAHPDEQVQIESTASDEEHVLDEADARHALDGVLDRLGAAHHRPFSRG